MNRAPFRDRFRNLAKDPSALLAYWGLRQSIKDCGPTVKLDDGFVIIIIPVGFRAQP